MRPSAIRPAQRGRPNKVTKPGPPPRQGGRTPRQAAAQLAAAAHHDPSSLQLDAAAAAAAAAHDLEDHLKADPASVFDDVRMGADDNYAAAAAAAAAMDTDLNEDAHGEAEAEADMDDHGNGTGAAGGLAPHVDLTAANILANGGAGVPGNGMSQPVQDQLQEMQQNFAHAQHAHQLQHQHQHQHQHQPAAQMGTPQQMQAGHQGMEEPMMKSTEELARESGYPALEVESALAKRLAREPGQRLAQQRRPDQKLNLARRSNVEALFAHIAGEPARVPCKNCHKGHGPWTSCVVVDGQMCGSCANCWFNASGARCSFHETRNPQVVAQHASILPATSASLANDPAYRFAASQPLLQTHGAATAAGMAGVSNPAAMLTNNPVLQQLVNRAMGEVRSADRGMRQLLQIDIAAKQLALQIAEYEELMALNNSGGHGQDAHHHPQQQQQAGGGSMPGQQVMGDESGA